MLNTFCINDFTNWVFYCFIYYHQKHTNTMFLLSFNHEMNYIFTAVSLWNYTISILSIFSYFVCNIFGLKSRHCDGFAAILIQNCHAYQISYILVLKVNRIFPVRVHLKNMARIQEKKSVIVTVILANRL